MTRAPLLVLAVLFFLTPATACGPSVDLSKALEVTDLLTGYYDDGVKDGKNHLVPSISFRLHNKESRAIGPVQLSVAFWQKGADGEWDSTVVQAITGRGLDAGATTDSILVRASVGYNLEGARTDLFNHSQFKDVIAKLFASQAGEIVPIGQYTLDRSIIPHLSPR
jgi:hypothetical protein